MKKIDWDKPVHLTSCLNDLYSNIEVDTWDDDDNVAEVFFTHKDNEKYRDLICYNMKTGFPISKSYNKKLFELSNEK
jgi:hypothetical protein